MWDRRDSDELVTSARSLIRMVHRGASASFAKATYSAMLRPASRMSWASRAQGRRVTRRTTDNHEASSLGVSQSSACSSVAGNPSEVPILRRYQQSELNSQE